jgi:ligand-binding SRPBCC domain-containing protein
MARHRLERTQLVPREVSEVFAFFAAAENLERLTPPALAFHIHTPPPIVMRPGALIDYTIRLRGLPLRWRTQIEDWAPERRFVDVQLRGPYRFWRHEHLFTAVGSGTEIRDVVDYELPLGPLGEPAHRAFVRAELDRIFDYRAGAVRELFQVA